MLPALDQRDVDPVAQVIQSFIAQNHYIIALPNTVLGFLREHSEHFQLVDPQELNLSDEAFVARIRQLKPMLRQVGIFVELDQHIVGHNCYISDNSHELRGFSFQVSI